MTRPKRAWRPLALAVLFIVAAVVAGTVLLSPAKRSGTLKAADVELGGAKIGTKPVALDLSSNISVRVLNPAYAARADHVTLGVSLAGVTVRNLSAPLLGGRGVLDTKVARYVAAGSLKGRVELSAKSKQIAFAEFRMNATQPWYSTAEGILAVLVILAGLASLEGALRPLRAGRRRVSAFVWSTIASAVIAVGVVGIFAVLGHADPAPFGLVVVASAAGVGGTALAAAAYRRGRRLSTRRAVRRAVLKAPQDAGQAVDYAS